MYNKNMRNEILTVVVAVYNCARYIAECLQSIIFQSYKYLDIVIVDDGSTDNTLSICNTYRDRDSRITIIHQENMGRVKARCSGVQVAKGRYITFVDGDDYLELDYYERIMQFCNDYDLITAGYLRSQHDIKVKYFDAIETGSYSSEEQVKVILDNMPIKREELVPAISYAIWNKVFKTSLIKRIAPALNEELYYGEDLELVCRYLCYCKSVYVTDLCGYNHRVHDQATTQIIDDEFLKNLNELYLTLSSVLGKHNNSVEKYIALQLTYATKKMGFSTDNQTLEYILPWINQLSGKKIILYGAGRVGVDYYRQITTLQQGELVLWIDRNWKTLQEKGYKVESLDRIVERDYDAILIASLKKNLADSVAETLIELGVSTEKILWKEPIKTTLEKKL